MVLFDGTGSAQRVQSAVPVDEVGTVLPEVVGSIHEDGLHESTVRILAAVGLAVGVVELRKYAGGSGAGHGSARFKPIGIGRNAGVDVGSECRHVGLDAAVVGGAAAT